MLLIRNQRKTQMHDKADTINEREIIIKHVIKKVKYDLINIMEEAVKAGEFWANQLQ